MPFSRWADDARCGVNTETWAESRVASREISPEAFMEELCMTAGGYSRFFRTLAFHYFGWWAAIVVVPGVFLDHHRCEASQPYFAWILYAATVSAMLVMAVLLELAVVQRLGLLQAGELAGIWQEPQWQLPLLSTVLWKLDSYTDVAFIFVARDCGSTLWWASLAVVIFVVVFCQMVFNTCFACSDCDGELPKSFGFWLLDFKLVNAAVRGVLPFDPDASDLPVGKQVTLKTTVHLVSLEKAMGNIAQVSIQSLFLANSAVPHGFVIFSVLLGTMNGCLSVALVVREALRQNWAVKGIEQGTVLAPGSLTSANVQLGLSSAAEETERLTDMKELQYERAIDPSTIGKNGSASAALGARPSLAGDAGSGELDLL